MSIDTITAINTVRLVMTLQEARARVAAQNIALANIPNSKVSYLDINTPMSQLRAALADPVTLVETIDRQSLQSIESLVSKRHQNIDVLSLDNEVAELSTASGRYQALADGLSRQFALMQMAVRGGK